MEYKTKHYIFSIENNEIAKRDIKHIAKIQEDAYEKNNYMDYCGSLSASCDCF